MSEAAIIMGWLLCGGVALGMADMKGAGPDTWIAGMIMCILFGPLCLGIAVGAALSRRSK